MTSILLILIAIISIFALYVIIVGVRMSGVHENLEKIHRELKQYRKNIFQSVRPIFCTSESEYQELVKKAKVSIEESRQYEKNLPRNKMIWLSPITKNPENHLTKDMRDYLEVVRTYKPREYED